MSYSGVLRAMLVVLDAFTVVIAINGAIALTSGLELNRFSVELLRATPFRSYQLPGVIPGVWRAAAPLSPLHWIAQVAAGGEDINARGEQC
jgi:hypothetical protein